MRWFPVRRRSPERGLGLNGHVPDASAAPPSATARARTAIRLLWAFTITELRCLVFALLIFAAMAVTDVVETPIARYDLLLAAGVAITVVLWATGYETSREVGVIAAFHLLGLVMEIFKVQQGSWTYPDEGVTMVAGVPLYSGFMYAAVGSYLCQAWRRFDLRVTDYRPVPMTILAFVLIGFFLWLAENLGTFLGAWQYPDQEAFWRAVHVGKLGSWALLVTLSFALIATLKQYEGTLYGRPGDRPSVTRIGRREPSAD